MIREFIANSLISAGRMLGQTTGLQLAVELSEHSITIEMEQPDESNRAWDTSLYKHGNVFLDGYANPIKPAVDQQTGLENPDHVEEGESDSEGDGSDGPHTQLISSGRYRDYMRQDLISQLLTPESRWNKMLYGLIAVAALQFLGIIITLYATGSFQ
jgi:hypothetical protein